MKTTGHFSHEIPAINPIQWKAHQADLDAFVLEVLGTLGKTGAAVWYPMTVYTYRMVQAARRRLWLNGCALRCCTDVDRDRLYIRADFSTAHRFNAWQRQATTMGVVARKLRVLQGGKPRKRRAA